MNLSRSGHQIVRRPGYVDFRDYIYVPCDCKNRPAVGRISRLAKENNCPIHVEPLQYEYEHYGPTTRAGNRS